MIAAVLALGRRRVFRYRFEPVLDIIFLRMMQ